jgi:hypothetical protein
LFSHRILDFFLEVKRSSRSSRGARCSYGLKIQPPVEPDANLRNRSAYERITEAHPEDTERPDESHQRTGFFRPWSGRVGMKVAWT